MGYKTETHRHRQYYVGYQRVVKGKGGQIHGDGRCCDWVMGTQCNIQITHHRNMYLKAI